MRMVIGRGNNSFLVDRLLLDMGDEVVFGVIRVMLGMGLGGAFRL